MAHRNKMERFKGDKRSISFPDRITKTVQRGIIHIQIG